MADTKPHVFCPFCPLRKFKHIYAVRAHFVAKHGQTYCQTCNFDFRHPVPLINHFQLHHNHHRQSSSVSQNSRLSATTQVTHVSQVSRLSAQQLPPQSTQLAVLSRGFAPSVTSQVNQVNQVIQIYQVSQASHGSPQQLPLRYTKVAPEEHNFVLQELLSRRHSPGRLHSQGYKMPALPGPLVQNTRPPDQGAAGNASAQASNATERLPALGQGDSSEAPPKRSKQKHALPPELFESTPQRQPAGGSEKRRAVALDCEMVEIDTRYSEVAYLSAVDFLTGEVLIDSFVQPTGPVVSWRTKTSGIDARNMNEAVTSGKALNGWHAARDKLWEFIDDQTVLVGHALHNDLQVLGIYHPLIVDSSVVAAEAVFNTLRPDERLPRVWALKTLTKALLNRDIQNRGHGHSALEDAYAARDLVLCALCTPNTLAQWALVARQIEAFKLEERERMVEEARKKREEALREQFEQSAAQDQAQVAVSGTVPFEPRGEPANSSYGPPDLTHGPVVPIRNPPYSPQPMLFHRAYSRLPPFDPDNWPANSLYRDKGLTGGPVIPIWGPPYLAQSRFFHRAHSGFFPFDPFDGSANLTYAPVDPNWGPLYVARSMFFHGAHVVFLPFDPRHGRAGPLYRLANLTYGDIVHFWDPRYPPPQPTSFRRGYGWFVPFDTSYGLANPCYG